MIKAIFDTDPGTDDAVALIAALNSPAMDIVGVTAVGGNASTANAARNALRLLHYMGRTDIPVARGGPRPLQGEYHPDDFHGRAGLTVRLPLPSVGPIKVPAWDHIVSVASALRGELVLIPVGPLTNIAKALEREPRLKDWVKHMYIMGGAFETAGNVTPRAEFNIWDDALAAQRVLSSGIPATIVGLDVTNKVVFRRDETWWRGSNTRGGRLASRIVDNWLKRHRDKGWWVPHDALTVTAALHPDVLTCRTATVDVSVDGSDTHGKTTARYGQGDVRVALDVDVERARRLLWNLVTS